ncbi:MAG: TMEM165/GDT1 family protein [Elainellaceae cyanobacterium]
MSSSESDPLNLATQNDIGQPYTGDQAAPTDVTSQNADSDAAPIGELKLFLTTFVTIFVAEIGDKTQVTTLLMSAESQAPLTVFLGAGSALISTTLVGVLVGRWLSRRVSVDTLETATGALLAFISILLLWDVVNL